MKKFMCWWGGGYTSSIDTNLLSWFTTDIGYESEDIEILAGLEIGSTIVLSNGDHIITRVE